MKPIEVLESRDHKWLDRIMENLGYLGFVLVYLLQFTRAFPLLVSAWAYMLIDRMNEPQEEST